MTSSLSRATYRSLQPTEDFRFGAGAAPNAQGDLLVGDGSGGFAVKPLPPATPAATVLVAGAAAAPPSTRIDWAPLTIEDAAGASPGAASFVSGTVAASGGPAALGVRKVEGGTGVAATTSGADLVLNADFTVGSDGGGPFSLVAASSAPGIPVLRTLAAGANFAFVESGDLITISATDPGGSGAPATLSSAGGTETLVVNGTGPALTVKGLVAGGGSSVALASDATSVTISSSAVAPTTVTLTSAGGAQTLVNDGTGPSLVTKGILAGTGISVSSNATDVTVAMAFNVGSAGGGIPLVSTLATPGNFVTRSVQGGTGIITSTSNNLITISSTGSLLQPRRQISAGGWFSGTNSLSVGSAYITRSMPNATTWYVIDDFAYNSRDSYLYDNQTGTTNGAFVANTGSATPATLLLLYQIIVRIDNITGGIMAGIFRTTPTSTLIQQTVTQNDKTGDGIAILRCSAVYTGVSDGDTFALHLRSMGGTDTAVELYYTIFGGYQLYPSV